MESFDSNRSTVSWVGSLMIGIYNLSGPIGNQPLKLNLIKLLPLAHSYGLGISFIVFEKFSSKFTRQKVWC